VAALTCRPVASSDIRIKNGYLRPTARQRATLQEKQQVIAELQSALDAARRRCSLLEMQLSNQHHAAASKQSRSDRVKDAAELSSLHFHKYRQIRQDYHRLINKCARCQRPHTPPPLVARFCAALVAEPMLHVKDGAGTRLAPCIACLLLLILRP
jgi:hypothetical protein